MPSRHYIWDSLPESALTSHTECTFAAQSVPGKWSGRHLLVASRKADFIGEPPGRDVGEWEVTACLG